MPHCQETEIAGSQVNRVERTGGAGQRRVPQLIATTDGERVVSRAVARLDEPTLERGRRQPRHTVSPVGCWRYRWVADDVCSIHGFNDLIDGFARGDWKGETVTGTIPTSAVSGFRLYVQSTHTRAASGCPQTTLS